MRNFIIALLALTGAWGNMMAQSVRYGVAEGAVDATTDMLEKSQRIVDITSGRDVEGVPYIGVFGGMSHAYGEFGRLRFCFPGMSGFDLFGGVGKEYLFNSDWKDRMTWHVGLGYYFTDAVITGNYYDSLNILSIDLVVGRTPLCEDVAIMAQFEWDHFFGEAKRFGVFGAVGFGFGELDRDEPKILWDVSLGVAVKLYQN